MRVRTVIIISIAFLGIHPVLPQSAKTDLVTAGKYLERGRILYEKSEYDSLPYYFLTAKAIFQRHDRPVQIARCYIGMADYYRISLRFGESEATLDSVDLYIQEHIGTITESWADALITRGKLLTVRSQYPQAIELINQGQELLLSLGATPEKIANTENLLGASYHRMGDLENARDHYIKSYDRYQQMNAEPSAQMGWLLYNIALMYNRLGNQEKWKEYISKYITNIIAYAGPDNPDRANYYSSVASSFIDYGMPDSALVYLEKSEEIERNLPNEDHRGLVTLFIQRARIYRLEGDYHRALEYCQRALGILEKNMDTKGFHGRSLYLNMGKLYILLGEYESAEQILLHLIDLKAMVHPTHQATYLYYLADVNRRLGNHHESEQYFRKVFEIHEQYPPEAFESRESHYLGYGILLDSLEMFEKAYDYFQRAVKIAEESYGFNHLRTARVLKSTGDHHALVGELEKALEYYQQSILSMVPEFDVNKSDSNPPPEQIHDHLFYLGLLKSKASVLAGLAGMAADNREVQQWLTAVYSAYQTSIRIIDQLRNSYLSDRSRMYLSENERDTYDKFVETAFQCFGLTEDPQYLEQAFMAAEKAKYATLLSVIQREETIALAGIPDSIVQMDADLRKELSLHQEWLLESQGDTIYDTLAAAYHQAQIFQLSANIESLNHRLERDYPHYYDLLYNQQVIHPDDLRKKLRPSENMLEYFYAGNDLYRFELSRQGMDCHRIPLDADFDRELAGVLNYLSGHNLPDSVSSDHETFLANAHSLYERLIPDDSDQSRLIIIPEGRLSYLPFDVLVEEPVLEFSGFFNQVPFLITDHTIRYGYSATLLEKMERKGRIEVEKLIAFAPGYGNDPDTLASAGKFREVPIDRRNLTFLPGTLEEVREISLLSGGRAFTGTDASETVFKELAGESHIIHLATHAYLDDDEPLRSKLVFSEGTDDEDGFLNVYEIYNMDLAAGMVVLSACNTGAGIIKGGEGIMSLARAFIYAGVPNIVMTLWTVSDKQSYRLMLGFYRRLISGRSPEAALRQAKLEFLEQVDPRHQHPQYWAGYILVGDPDRFHLLPAHRMIIPAGLIGVIMLAGYIIIRKRGVRRKG